MDSILIFHQELQYDLNRGEEKEAALTAMGGSRRVFGFNDLTCARVSESTKAAALNMAKQKGFIK